VERLEHRWCPSYSLVTSRTALAGTDSVNWGTLGSSGVVANPFTILSTAGQSLTVSKKITGEFSFETAFKVNFAPGDVLLDTEGPPNAGGNGDNNITLNFGAKLVAAGGAQIASDVGGSFTAQVQALDANGHTLASFTEQGTTTTVLDNSAIFIGISSTSASISQIAISLTKVSPPQNKALFAINKFDFRTSPLGPAPAERRRAQARDFAAVGSSLLGTGQQARLAAPRSAPTVPSAPTASPSGIRPAPSASSPPPVAATDAVFAASHTAARDDSAWPYAPLSSGGWDVM
jgi:hypothetical protein